MTFKLVWVAYHYEGMCRAVMALVLWYRRQPGLQALFTEFDDRFYTDDIMPYEQAARQLVNGLLAGSGITLLVLSTLICYGLFTTDRRLTDVYHITMLPYSEPMDAGENSNQIESNIF